MNAQPQFHSLAIVAGWTLATICGVAEAQQAAAPPVSVGPVLTIRNDMTDAVYFWIKSEARKDWKYFVVAANGGTQQITLVSPDRFELHSCDTQGGEFYLGLRPLKQMLQADPNMVLTLGGVFETGNYNQRYWSSRERRWRWRRRQGYARMAVLYEFNFSNGEVITDQANRQ